MQSTLEGLDSISLDELAQYILAPGPIYLFLPKNKTKILLFQTGQFIEQQKIEDLKAKDIWNLYYRQEINTSLISQGKELIAAIHQARLESEKIKAKDHFIFWIQEHFLNQTSNTSNLDFLQIMLSFNTLPLSVIQHVQNKSLLLFQRNMLAASLACLFSLKVNLLDQSHLQKIFSLSFCFEFNYWDSTNDFKLLTQLENRRLSGLPSPSLRPKPNEQIYKMLKLDQLEIQLRQLLKVHQHYEHFHQFSLLEKIISAAHTLVPYGYINLHKSSLAMLKQMANLQHMQNPLKSFLKDLMEDWGGSAGESVTDEKREAA